MTEQQNCSKSPNNNPTAKQWTSLSTLSRIFKTQASSIQHRAACPDIKNKPSGGPRMFFIKALIGSGAIYLTALLGVWAEAEESTKIYSKLKQAISRIDNEKMTSDSLKIDLLDQMNKSKEFLKGHLGSIPGEMKVYYEKSEKYINDLMKGKKSS